MQRVLIVEDEEIIRRGLLATIDWAGMGCRIVGDAPDGKVGLELLRTERSDVVLTDIRMPRMDGIEMAEAARDRTRRQFGNSVQFFTPLYISNFAIATASTAVLARETRSLAYG